MRRRKKNVKGSLSVYFHFEFSTSLVTTRKTLETFAFNYYRGWARFGYFRFNVNDNNRGINTCFVDLLRTRTHMIDAKIELIVETHN